MMQFVVLFQSLYRYSGSALLTIVLLTILLYTILHDVLCTMYSPSWPHTPVIVNERLRINLASTLCGKLEQATALFKSAIWFSKDVHLHFVLMTDKGTWHNLNDTMVRLQNEGRKVGYVFTYELNLIWFPNSLDNWKGMYRPCTTQRIFYPSLLTHLDAVIHIDTDAMFVGNVSKLWEEFSRMDEQQMIGMSRDSFYTYNGRRRIPYVDPIGVNGGICLMNLTPLRMFDFERKIIDVLHTYRSRFNFADQDLFNILFSENPSKIRVLGYSFNFLNPRCGDNVLCQSATSRGIYVLHGAGGQLETAQHQTSIFSYVHSVMKKVKLTDPVSSWMTQLDKGYKAIKKKCSTVTSELLLRNANNYFAQLRLLAS